MFTRDSLELEGRRHNLGTTFAGSPLKFGSAKNVQYPAQFLTTSTLITSISGADQQDENRKKTSDQKLLRRWNKKLMKFGPLASYRR